MLGQRSPARSAIVRRFSCDIARAVSRKLLRDQADGSVTQTVMFEPLVKSFNVPPSSSKA